MDLNRYPVFSFLLHCIITILCLVGMVGMFLLWASSPQESTEDAYTVTIDYDCRQVLLTPNDWPVQVVEECRDKFTTLPPPIKPTT